MRDGNVLEVEYIQQSIPPNHVIDTSQCAGRRCALFQKSCQQACGAADSDLYTVVEMSAETSRPHTHRCLLVHKTVAAGLQCCLPLNLKYSGQSANTKWQA